MGEINCECRIGVPVVPFDQIADRSTEDGAELSAPRVRRGLEVVQGMPLIRNGSGDGKR
jgi:hypothetical protein